MDRENMEKYYKIFRIRKSDGRLRVIHAPSEELKAKQRQLLQNLYRLGIGPSPYSMAFVKKRGIKDHVSAHVGKKYVCRIDIKDFFPSVHPEDIRKALWFEGFSEKEIEPWFEEPPEGAKMQDVPPPTALLWYAMIPDGDGRLMLPQGAPTSPYLANLAFKRIDFRIKKLIREYADKDARYTRYADDLIISSDRKAIIPMVKPIRKILELDGFYENRKKWRVFRSTGRQAITGVVVNQKPSIPKDTRGRYRARLHELFQMTVQGKDKEGREVDYEALGRQYKVVAGEFSWMGYIDPERKRKYQPKLDAVEAILRARQAI